MKAWTEEKMRAMGMTDTDIRRAQCEHDYGTMCESSFLGCFRTCVKCGQKMGLGRHCGGTRSTSATACKVEVYSSRMCERGTKSCTVEHT